MTEEELKQQIDTSEGQIHLAYNNLMSAARDVGNRGVQAAQSTRDSAVSGVSGKKTINTLWPLAISFIGFMFFTVLKTFGFIMIVGGIILAYNLRQKAAKEEKDTRSRYDSMLNVATNQRKTLDAFLDNNATI